jgi:hypothetical protein
MRVLFVTFDGGGNLPPALGIAAEIVRRGGEAVFLGGSPQLGAIKGGGFRFEPLREGRDYDSSADGSLRRSRHRAGCRGTAGR